MRAKEFLTELEVDRGIIDILIQRGYTRLGAGQDQMVFLEPDTGLVLKIFGTNGSLAAVAGSNRLTFPQRTFTAFADYCAQNPDNEFLPYFSGWETFEFNNRRYLQIRVERLFPGNDMRLFSLLAEMADAITSGQYDLADSWIKDNLKYDSSVLGELVSITGEEGFHKLWKTLEQLALIATTINCHMDLHSDNFMLGSDGHIVISDPFFSGWGRREK